MTFATAAVLVGWALTLLGFLGYVRKHRDDWNRGVHIQGPRRALYDALIGVRDRTSGDGVPSREDLSTLHRLAEESRLLFGKEITAYLEEWIEHAAESITAKGVLQNPLSPADQREDWARKDHAAVTFFSHQYGTAIAKRFKKYIGSL